MALIEELNQQGNKLFKYRSNLPVPFAVIGLAIFIMMLTNTIHPPAGANPIIVILGGKGLSFILMPVAIGAVIITLFAIIYNKMLGKNYPKKI